MNNNGTGHIVVISGPSGSGESTITKALLERLPARRLITATTRAPRDGELEGVDYFFFAKERFEEELKNGNIPEYSYISNRDTYYGTYRPELARDLESGNVIIANTDIVGTKFFKEQFGADTIFIAPESLEILANRLRIRNPDMSEKELERRLDNAREEIEKEKPYYDYVIENRDGKLSEAVDQAEAYIRERLGTLKGR
ncbi:MAG: guanylate kinase [Candidatus Moranbacteria bacterium]|nr:guanylate kinase [Candidatus Moranbacteria bacterium]